MTNNTYNKKSMLELGLLSTTVVVLMAAGFSPSANAAVGDVQRVVNASSFIDENDVFCSIGLSFDGSHLYWDACGTGTIWITDTAANPTVVDSRDFSPEIPELPNAMAFDVQRGVTYAATQGPDVNGCPVYEIDHKGTLGNLTDDTVTKLFSANATVIGGCFVDGLAYNNNDSIAGDDALYMSGDAQRNMGIYFLNGTLAQQEDTTDIDSNLSTTSGLAVGGTNLYLANNGGGDVFRASLPDLTLVDQFVSADERQEDLECDPVTFGGTEVMWLRTTPQGGSFDNVATAFEIEPDTCAFGGGDGEPQEVDVPADIKPQSCPNPVNVNSNGVLPAAILGTSNLNVTDINATSLRLEGVSPLRHNIEDVATPFEPFIGKESKDDCNEKGADGFEDLTLKFDKQQVVDALPSLADGEVITLNFTGNLNDDAGATPINGEDVVVIINKTNNAPANGGGGPPPLPVP